MSTTSWSADSSQAPLHRITGLSRPGQQAAWVRVSLPRLVGMLLAAAGLVGGTLVAKSTTGAVHRALTPARRGEVRHGMAALPVQARGPVSAALGRSDRAYWLGDLTAHNPAQRFAARFTSGGVAVTSGAGRLSLRLAAMGRGKALSALPSTSPQASENRVAFVRPEIREWYANGPLGLEQGFEIPRRPAGNAPLTLAIALSRGVHPRLDGTGALLVGDRVSLRYSGLSATDDRGRAIPAWLVMRSGGLEIRVDDRGAKYPLRIDPLVQQGSKLVGSHAAGDALQGISVALSSDGNTALVGGPGDANNVGAAWVFGRAGSTWTQRGSKLVGSDATAQARQGFSVALSSDGQTALVGGPGDNNNLGAVWVYTWTGATWAQQGSKLVGSDATAQASQGFSVALSSDGNTALVGGANDNGDVGAAWVYTRTGATWSQEGPKLVGGDATGSSYQGFSVALSSDGNTALVGGPGDNNVGATWMYARTGDTWAQQGSKLVGSDEIGAARQGYSVALSSDGGTALIGGPYDNAGEGAVWAFSPPTDPLVVRHSLSVTLVGNGSGTVTGSGISCPGTCSQLYANGTAVTLTVTAPAGSTFSGWSGGCSGKGVCNLTMSADHSVKATFVKANSGGGSPSSNSTPRAPAHRPILSALRIFPRIVVLTGRLAGGACVAITRSNLRRPVCARLIRSRISYDLDMPANVTITIARVLPGRQVRGGCAPPRRGNRGHASCRRLAPVRGSIIRAGNPGHNAFTFNDKIGGRRLNPGRYLLTATPAANGQSGTRQAVPFAIVQ